MDTELHIAGRHNLRNALAATATALAAGAPLAAVAQGLRDFRPVAGHSRTHVLGWNGHHCTLIDDTYNANPDSVLAAIDVLAEMPAPHLLVLGDMGEVGVVGHFLVMADQSAEAHARGIQCARLERSNELSQALFAPALPLSTISNKWIGPDVPGHALDFDALCHSALQCAAHNVCRLPVPMQYAGQSLLGRPLALCAAVKARRFRPGLRCA
jgi:hypothetical protein